MKLSSHCSEGYDDFFLYRAHGFLLLMYLLLLSHFSHVWLCATPWIAAYQAPPSMGFPRQEYWSADWCTYLKTIHGTIFSTAVIFKANSFGYVNRPLLICKQKARTKSLYWTGCSLALRFRETWVPLVSGVQGESLPLCLWSPGNTISSKKIFEREKRFLLWGWFLSALLHVFGTAFFFFNTSNILVPLTMEV